MKKAVLLLSLTMLAPLSPAHSASNSGIQSGTPSPGLVLPTSCTVENASAPRKIEPLFSNPVPAKGYCYTDCSPCGVGRPCADHSSCTQIPLC